MLTLSRIRNLWQESKSPILFSVIFSVVYVVISCLWFLESDDKFFPDRPKSYIVLATPMLGWAVFFLKGPAYVFIPASAVSGGLIGLLTKILLPRAWQGKFLGLAVWIAIIYVNYYIGVFFYAFGVMIW